MSQDTIATKGKAPWLTHIDTDLECANETRLFFPPDYTATFHDDIEKAKALCMVCPLARSCLEWALPQTSLEGIWGATTPADRRRIRRRRKKIAA